MKRQLGHSTLNLLLLCLSAALTAVHAQPTAAAAGSDSAASHPFLTPHSAINTNTNTNTNTISAIDWSHLNASTLSQLTPADFANATAANIEIIPPDACHGFRAEQIAALTQTCSAFATTCFYNIPATAFAGVSTSCLTVWRAVWLKGISSEQIASIPPSAWDGASAEQMQYLVDNCAGFSVNATAHIQAAACTGLRSLCINSLAESAIPGLSGECLVSMPPFSLSSMTSIQFAAIPPDRIPYFTSNQTAALTNANCPGFTVDQIKMLNTDADHQACSGFGESCFISIPPPSFAQLQAGCMSELTSSVFEKASPEQLGQMAADAWSGVTPKQMEVLTQCQTLTLEQVDKIPVESCAGFQSGCVGSLSVEAIPALSGECLVVMNPDSLSGLDADQLSAIPPPSIAAFGSDQTAALTGKSCAGFTMDQVAALNADEEHQACTGLNLNCFHAIPPLAFTQLQAGCMSEIDPAILASSTSKQIGNMSAEAWTGLTPQQMAAFTLRCDSIQPEQMNNIPHDSCVGVGGTCLSVFSLETTSVLTGECLVAMPPTSLGFLSADQLHVLSPESVSYFTFEQTSNLKAMTCAGFTTQQVQALHAHTTACTGLASNCIGYIPPDAFSGFAPTCVSNLVDDAFAFINSTQFAALSDRSAGSIRQEQFASMNPDACAGFNSQQIGALQLNDSHACQGLQCACMSAIFAGALSTLTASCVSNMTADAWGALNQPQISSVPAASFHGVYADQLHAMPVESVYGIDWLRFQVLWQDLGSDAVLDSWSVDQKNALGDSVIAQFLLALDAQTITGSRPWTTMTKVQQQSALDLAYSDKHSMRILFATAKSPNNLPTVSWRGLRAVFVPATSAAGIAALDHPEAWSYWVASAQRALNARQLSSICINCIGHLPINGFSPSAITGMTAPQLEAEPLMAFQVMSCPIFYALTDAQQNLFNNLHPREFEMKVIKCGEPPVASSSSSSSTGADYSSSSTGEPEPEHKRKLTRGEIAAIAAGVALLLVAIATLIFRKCRRRRTYTGPLDEGLLDVGINP